MEEAKSEDLEEVKSEDLEEIDEGLEKIGLLI